VTDQQLRSIRYRIEEIENSIGLLASQLLSVARELKLIEQARRVGPSVPGDSLHGLYEAAKQAAQKTPLNDRESARYVKTPWGLLDRYAQLFVAT
jgi:hypothetical protein